MTPLPIRRIAWVLLAYGFGAWLILNGASWFQRVLALPSLFETLLRGGLLAGIPIAVLVAWRYPELGGAPLEGAPEDRALDEGTDP